MKNRDEFTFGKEITLAGGKQDECAVDYLEDRKYGEELRTKVSIETKEENYTVMVEAVNSQQGIVLGSGVLATLGLYQCVGKEVGGDTKENRCILTAAHCIISIMQMDLFKQ